MKRSHAVVAGLSVVTGLGLAVLLLSHISLFLIPAGLVGVGAGSVVLVQSGTRTSDIVLKVVAATGVLLNVTGIAVSLVLWGPAAMEAL